ncbi:2784_t:CDS:2 [Gigaspora margarita]|uniref:2784_t:CDS:1 n=1 Tax=Gigaspora margarita TaxID=4874 RepID=A0ABN7V8W8_GIGMA|nr:2784_t:CDS:2 [Gigaspora margarita]
MTHYNLVFGQLPQNDHNTAVILQENGNDDYNNEESGPKISNSSDLEESNSDGSNSNSLEYTSDYPDLDIVPLNNILTLRQAGSKQNITCPIHNIHECQTYNIQYSSHTSHTMQECPTQEHPTKNAQFKNTQHKNAQLKNA